MKNLCLYSTLIWTWLILNGCGQSVLVVDHSGHPIEGVRFDHDMVNTNMPGKRPFIFYSSHNRTDRHGKAFVTQMHWLTRYTMVRVVHDEYKIVSLSADEFNSEIPKVIVMEPLPQP